MSFAERAGVLTRGDSGKNMIKPPSTTAGSI